MGAAHFFPYAAQQIGEKQISLTADNIWIMLIASGDSPDPSAWNAYQFLADFTGSSDFPQTEVAGTGYTAGGQLLTSPALTYSGLTVTWTFANPAWASSTITAIRAVFYDKSVGAGPTSYPLIAWDDFGTSVASSAGLWTYGVNSNGLLSQIIT
jgi:hypothetical protein